MSRATTSDAEQQLPAIVPGGEKRGFPWRIVPVIPATLPRGQKIILPL
jgi:hypothetical protein